MGLCQKENLEMLERCAQYILDGKIQEELINTHIFYNYFYRFRNIQVFCGRNVYEIEK